MDVKILSKWRIHKIDLLGSDLSSTTNSRRISPSQILNRLLCMQVSKYQNLETIRFVFKPGLFSRYVICEIIATSFVLIIVSPMSMET